MPQAPFDPSSHNEVLIAFGFPEVIRMPASTYLLGFVTFLRNLGLDSDFSLRDDSSVTGGTEVKFSISPRPPDARATRVVPDALRTYLQLVDDPQFDMATKVDGDIAIGDLRHVVFRLREALHVRDWGR
jgi:hypothetical protein